MLNCVLLVHVLLQIKALFVPDFDMADVQRVDYGLYSLRLAAWRRSKGKNTKVRVLSHEIANDLRIRIVSASFMSLIFKRLSMSESLDWILGLKPTDHE